MSETEADPEEEELDGESENSEEPTPYISYEVTSYGSDPEVEILVSRVKRGDIFIPPFQRDYVWRQPEASKFIESLLLGLPVPGIFLAADPTTNKSLVIDGQQRLKTLQFFYDGYFNPKPGDSNRRIFNLIKVQKQFEGKTYKTLADHDRVRLDTSIIHATTIKQTAPIGDDTSLYHIFERLNSGGRRLTDQEMRHALYHGTLISALKDLNEDAEWREAFGKVHSRLKDIELLLRFFALLNDLEKYERPMGEFLNKYAGRNQNIGKERIDSMNSIFKKTINMFKSSVSRRLFRLKKSFNVAVFDSCMVGLARRILDDQKAGPSLEKIGQAYERLLLDTTYIEKTSRSTADKTFVEKRIELATEAFRGC